MMFCRLRITVFFALCSVLLLALPGAIPASPPDVTAGETVVTVIGSARVEGNSVERARSKAISYALVTAIDEAATALLPLDYRIERFNALNQILYSQSNQFALGYKVLTEAKSGRFYRVLVAATISMDMLRQQLDDAGLLPEKRTMPKLLLLISEQNLEDFSPHFWWGIGMTFLESACENQMAQALELQGFKLIDHDTGMPPEDNEQQAPVVSLPTGHSPSDEEALAMGKRFGADIVIVAMAKAKNIGNVMGQTYKSFKGEIVGRILRTDSGEKIGDIYKSAVAMNADAIAGGRQALKDVGALAAETLGTQILAAWQKNVDDNVMVTFFVEGTRRLANFVKFRNLLHDLPMVSQVDTTSLKPNEATLLVRCKGSTQGIADALMLKSFDSFAINITDISIDYIYLALIPK